MISAALPDDLPLDDDSIRGLTPPPRAVSPRLTERDMFDLLHDRYSRLVMGTRRYACAEHVASHCGYWNADGYGGSPRRADFLAQDTQPSQGLLLHGHEVKVSRSDWLVELRDPNKSEAIKRFCDRWWLVAADKAIVRDDLPEDWGLIAPSKGGALRVLKRAPVLDPEPIPATFRAALMRAVAATSERRQLS